MRTCYFEHVKLVSNRLVLRDLSRLDMLLSKLTNNKFQRVIREY
jgi:hypothetical protein